MSNSSFVNGIIVGAGIVLAFMSYVLLQYIAPVENQNGVSSTEIRVSIMLGGIVAAVAIGYEFYSRKIESKSLEPNNESNVESQETDTIFINDEKKNLDE
jgi:hypothetical protein|tara:strand:+ start:143 stop:442 length:300 start_codon:yes stop_codon:yes gene_type:complete